MKSIEQRYEEMIERSVNRFLCWKLPKDFYPDGGVSFSRNPDPGSVQTWPVGTNLLTAIQAKEMFKECFPLSSFIYMESGK